MTEKEQQDLDSWDGFLGSNFLKAEDVADNQIFICKGVGLSDDARPRLELESENTTYNFDLNVTNSNAFNDAGIKSPKDAIGKKIVFRKVMVTSPKTKKEVETLRIKSVE